MLNKFKQLENFNGFSLQNKMFYFDKITLEQHIFLQNNYIDLIKNYDDMCDILYNVIINKEEFELIKKNEFVVKKLFSLMVKGTSVTFEHDFYLKQTLESFNKVKKDILMKYVNSLLLFGYKYIDIKKMTDTEIIECAIFEIGLRSEKELIDFLTIDQTESISEILKTMNETLKVEMQQVATSSGNSAYDQLVSL